MGEVLTAQRAAFRAMWEDRVRKDVAIGQDARRELRWAVAAAVGDLEVRRSRRATADATREATLLATREAFEDALDATTGEASRAARKREGVGLEA